jgi:hypothetical protein
MKMLTPIQNLPPDVLGFEASGRVTHKDYQCLLIPDAEAMMRRGPLKMIYVLGKEFSGYDIEAMWDDASFGIRHRRDFGRVAVVGDQMWLQAAISLFKPFFPCDVRLFSLGEIEAAKDWITNPGAAVPPRTGA